MRFLLESEPFDADSAMEPQWTQDDLFPIIAEVIGSLHEEGQDFVTHDQIVSTLLQSSEAARHIDEACQSSETDRSRDWVAHNMVAWFSQRITVGESDWSDRYERQKVDGKWAYKPLT